MLPAIDAFAAQSARRSNIRNCQSANTLKIQLYNLLIDNNLQDFDYLILLESSKIDIDILSQAIHYGLKHFKDYPEIVEVLKKALALTFREDYIPLNQVLFRRYLQIYKLLNQEDYTVKNEDISDIRELNALNIVDSKLRRDLNRAGISDVMQFQYIRRDTLLKSAFFRNIGKASLDQIDMLLKDRGIWYFEGNFGESVFDYFDNIGLSIDQKRLLSRSKIYLTKELLKLEPKDIANNFKINPSTLEGRREIAYAFKILQELDKISKTLNIVELELEPSTTSILIDNGYSSIELLIKGIKKASRENRIFYQNIRGFGKNSYDTAVLKLIELGYLHQSFLES